MPIVFLFLRLSTELPSLSGHLHISELIRQNELYYTVHKAHPVNNRNQPNVVLMLVDCLQYSPNIKTTLGLSVLSLLFLGRTSLQT